MHDFPLHREPWVSRESRTSLWSERALGGKGHLLGRVGGRHGVQGAWPGAPAAFSHFLEIGLRKVLSLFASAESRLGMLSGVLMTLVSSLCETAVDHFLNRWGCSQENGRGYQVFCPHAFFLLFFLMFF